MIAYLAIYVVACSLLTLVSHIPLHRQTRCMICTGHNVDCHICGASRERFIAAHPFNK